MKRYFIFLSLFLLGACQWSEPSTANLASYSESVTTDTARHIFTRDNSLVAALLKIKVKINGREAGRLGIGQTISVDVPAGPTTVVTELFGDSGNFTVTGDAKSGKTDRYIITANNNAWKQALCGTLCLDGGGSFKIIPEGY